MERGRSILSGLAALVILPLPSLAIAASETQGAAAIIESIENAPNAGVDFLDYVYPEQTIDLGPRGTLVLSYFDSCLVETVRGGEITVRPGASEVRGGRVSSKKVPCQGTQMFVTAELSEAGATVNRVGEEYLDDWSEWTVTAMRPTFKWDQGGQLGASLVSVLDVEADPPRMIWHGQVAGDRLQYPQDAPALEVGWPYKVQVTRPDGREPSAYFSIDPDLELPNLALSGVVPLRLAVAAPVMESEPETSNDFEIESNSFR